MIFCFVLVSCNFNHEPDVKKAFGEIALRHPDIYKQDVFNHYNLTRTIINAVDSVTMSLYIAPNNEDEKIVVLSNQKGQVYAIPFPDDDKRRYWAFFADSTYQPENNTFSGELNNAIKAIDIKNNRFAVGVLGDMFTSLIGSEVLCDTSVIKKYANKNNPSDSCSYLQNKNYVSILELMKGQSSFWDFNAFCDGNRTYQINISGKLQTGNYHIDVHVYRQPCIIKPIYL